MSDFPDRRPPRTRLRPPPAERPPRPPPSAATGAESARFRTLRQRVAVGVIALFVLLVFGVVGYVTIEGWSFLEALYMTVITVTTVGYREVRPLSDSGLVFTIFVALFGVGLALYILTLLVQSVVEGELTTALGIRRMKAQIDKLQDHYILCGFGRVGQEIAREFKERDAPFVIIDLRKEATDRAHRDGILAVQGDATEDAVLESAGIRRARSLMAAFDSDAANTYITLAAKALNPAIFVVARAAGRESSMRVQRSGADRVISPYEMAGRRMVLSALQPLTLEFFDVLSRARSGDQLLAELVVAENSVIAHQSVAATMPRCTATRLLAVQHANGEIVVGPSGAYVFRPGDRLMLVSVEKDMETLGETRDAPWGTDVA